MYIYIFLALLPFITYFVLKGDIYSQKGKRIFCYFCGFGIFLFFALRNYGVGNPDTQNYFNIMKYAIRTENLSQFVADKSMIERGFIVFVFFISRILKFPQAILIISGAIYATSISYHIYNNSKNVCLSFFVYITLGLMTFEFTAMRQALAICICLFAYEFAKRKKLVLFLASVLLATLFHQTAIVFLIVYPLFNLHYSLKNTVLIIVSSAILIYFSSNIISFANNYFGRNYTNIIESGGYVMTFCYLLPCILWILFGKKEYIGLYDDIDNADLMERKSNSALFYISIIAASIYIMRYFGAQAAERISFYFMFSQILLVPNVINDCDQGRNRQILTSFLVICGLILFIYRLNGSDLIPYYAFWRSL